MSFIKNTLLLIVSPAYEWAKIKKYRVDKDYLLSKLFYPLIAVLSLSVFVKYFYDNSLTLSSLLLDVVKSVTESFIGYLISAALLSVVCKEISYTKKGLNKIHVFVIYMYSILMLFSILTNCFSIKIALFDLLPIYSIYIIWKGYTFFDTKMNQGKFILEFSALTLCPYFLINLVFYLLLN